MKRTILLLSLLFLVSVCPRFAQAQNNPMRWKASIGMGFSSSEAINSAFATGAQVSYELKCFEFGLSFRHAFSQTLSSDKRHGMASKLPDQDASIYISNGSDDTTLEHNSGNTSSVDLYVGLDVLKLFKLQSKHSFVLAAFSGIGVTDNSYIRNSGNGMSIDVRYGDYLSYGAKVSYEYMVNNRVGFGVSAIYDDPQQNFYGLANLIVRF